MQGLSVFRLCKGDQEMWHAGVAEGTAALDWGKG